MNGRAAPGAQRIDEHGRLRRLAAAVDSFKCQEHATT
jgi:hypothetical protein